MCKTCQYCGSDTRKAKKPIRFIYWWEKDQKYYIDWFCNKKHFDLANECFDIKSNPIKITTSNFHLLSQLKIQV